ncbi:hypothetical protein GCN78_21050 [Janthinobacterium rivuli]|uniref:hypothetical protein n=1 Tax=Janthinobacterium sp. FT68W TaxID=2654255 RepID=UPI001265600E|nr:hypothetical protein [Janthinobacterium sp. FT68W]KAB8047885.1 hypothetical protein GCN78_21050 [Janthinobacterium sp. FT68W]
MLRLFKTWLILLLIVAVPLQAAAAGAMRTCAASPAVAVAAACQHQAAQSAAVPHNADTPEENTKPPAKHAACGACSSCCLGTLMAPCPALPAAACTGAQQVAIATATMLTGFIPDGPRRPPRPLSA